MEGVWGWSQRCTQSTLAGFRWPCLSGTERCRGHTKPAGLLSEMWPGCDGDVIPELCPVTGVLCHLKSSGVVELGCVTLSVAPKQSMLSGSG